jgi:WD40 repeat protein
MSLSKLDHDSLSSILIMGKPLAHDLAKLAPLSRDLNEAVKKAFKVRPYSKDTIPISFHTNGSPLHEPIFAVASTSDGRILTGSGGGSIHIWVNDVSKHITNAHDGCIFGLAILPDETHFVSVGEDGVGKLWTFEGALEMTFHIYKKVYCVAALRNKHIVVGLDNGYIVKWHLNGELVDVFKAHVTESPDTGEYEEHPVHEITTTVSGGHIISAGGDNLVKIWNSVTQGLVTICEGHTSSVAAVTTTPDDQRILSGGNDKTIRVWLASDGTLQSTFLIHNDLVKAIVSISDDHALCASLNGTIRLFNVNSGSIALSWDHPFSILGISLLPDGLRFVSCTSGESILITYHGMKLNLN